MTDSEKPALVENMLLLRKEDFDELLAHAAERGAERVLSHLGLENGHAARDIRELRDLLDAWRDARHTAWQTTVKVITTGILAALLVGAAIKLKLMGGSQ
ncbi:DUF6127 family protein [Ralstonia mannitolilytica]|uniref:DUF6127 family protein n=1 Tax=Ralstonia mannitolilytica TaxID=105219 RepID=UPI0028F518D9|nr:DUF6127 family protein [Ralstonia mannitolilytica]CAJ0727872.1 hypothetical protein R76706_01508 [Ralstonia mannitolilytica]